MGRQWCKTDPTVLIEGEPYALVLGIDGDARGHIHGVYVDLCIDGDIEVKGEGHKLLGVPIEIKVLGVEDEEEESICLAIESDGDFACSVAMYPRGQETGIEWAGAGMTNTTVEAVAVVPG